MVEISAELPHMHENNRSHERVTLLEIVENTFDSHKEFTKYVVRSTPKDKALQTCDCFRTLWRIRWKPPIVYQMVL